MFCLKFLFFFFKFFLFLFLFLLFLFSPGKTSLRKLLEKMDVKEERKRKGEIREQEKKKVQQPQQPQEKLFLSLKRTSGITMSEITLPSSPSASASPLSPSPFPSAPSSLTKYHIWDMGGHTVFKYTHSLFYHPFSLFLVL